MPRTCTICTHPNNTEIDKSLIKLQPIRGIARQFHVSHDALDRHKANCLFAVLAKAQDAREVASAETLLTELKRVNDESLLILEQVKKAKNHELALKAIGRIEKQIELKAKLLGELSEAPTINVTTISIEKMQAVIVNALKPFPDARLAVVEALEANGI